MACYWRTPSASRLRRRPCNNMDTDRYTTAFTANVDDCDWLPLNRACGKWHHGNSKLPLGAFGRLDLQLGMMEACHLNTQTEMHACTHHRRECDGSDCLGDD